MTADEVNSHHPTPLTELLGHLETALEVAENDLPQLGGPEATIIEQLDCAIEIVSGLAGVYPQLAQPLDLPIEDMRRLDFVRWDRYAGTPDRLSVFGWIDRPDTHADFVVLYVNPWGVGYVTSSAKWSAEIDRRLRSEAPAAASEKSHNPCQRVEHHPHAGELTKVVRGR